MKEFTVKITEETHKRLRKVSRHLKMPMGKIISDVIYEKYSHILNDKESTDLGIGNNLIKLEITCTDKNFNQVFSSLKKLSLIASPLIIAVFTEETINGFKMITNIQEKFFGIFLCQYIIDPDFLQDTRITEFVINNTNKIYCLHVYKDNFDQFKSSIKQIFKNDITLIFKVVIEHLLIQYSIDDVRRALRE